MSQQIADAIERCGELVARLAQVQRRGWFDRHPDLPTVRLCDEVMEHMDRCVEAFERVEGEIRAARFEHYRGDNVELSGGRKPSAPTKG